MPTLLGQPARLAAATRKSSADDHRILVVLELAGGNDGFNTVVPFREDAYYRARPTLAIRGKDVLRITDEVGFHPAAAGLKRLYDDGLLAVVQGVGYPDPSRSHFQSLGIWQNGSPGQRLRDGWLGRYFDHVCNGRQADPRLGVALTREIPPALRGDRFEPSTLHQLGQMNGFSGSCGIGCPCCPSAESLRQVSQLIGANAPARVYYVSVPGFDTHTAQAVRHHGLLRQLGDSLAAFVADIRAQGNLDRTLIMTVSEFGRRLEENACAGTDHGQGAPMLLVGGRIKPGVHGHSFLGQVAPGGKPGFAVDFRQVYAAVLGHWLDGDPKVVLGQEIRPAEVIRV